MPGVELELRDTADHRRAGSHEPTDDDHLEGPGRDLGARARTCSPATGPTAPTGPDADGWLGTGDLAYRDADGDLHLVDRRSDLILVSGFNVYPAEVERVLDAHPAVAESAVIGVPDPRTGSAVRAVVVLAAGAAT